MMSSRELTEAWLAREAAKYREYTLSERLREFAELLDVMASLRPQGGTSETRVDKTTPANQPWWPSHQPLTSLSDVIQRGRNVS